jgi:hypothetical protein
MFKSKKLLAVLGGAMIAVVGVLSVAFVQDSGDVQAAQQARFQCIGTFEASTLPGNRDLSVFGDITLDLGRDITGTLQTQDGNSIRMTTEVIGNGIFLAMELSDGVFVFGQGTATSPIRECRGGMGGTFTVTSIGGRVAGRPAPEPLGTWALIFR